MKRKRGNRRLLSRIIDLTIILVTVLFLSSVWWSMAASSLHKQYAECFNIKDTALIAYGTLDDHPNTSTNQVAIDHLAQSLTHDIDYHGHISHAPIDIELYARDGLLGSVLIMYNEKTFQWYGQKQNAKGVVCGVVEIDLPSIKHVFELMRGD